MSIPEAGYLTAIAVKHEGRMTEVSVTFTLRERDASSATYAGLCPRCNSGEIDVTVKLNADGSFAEVPAIPMLCMNCEDTLDVLLEPEKTTGTTDGPGNRESLAKYIKAMNVRSWD